MVTPQVFAKYSSRNQCFLKFHCFFKRLCQVSGRNDSFVIISPTGHISLKTAKLVSLLQMLASGFNKDLILDVH